MLLRVTPALAVRDAQSSHPERVAAFKSTRACAGCDLRHADLAGMQAPDAQLMNADLSDATFYGGNLRDADLTGAILDRPHLEMVDLTGATGAILETATTGSRTTCPDGRSVPLTRN